MVEKQIEQLSTKKGKRGVRLFDDKSLEQVTKNRPTVKVTESVRKDTDTQTPSSENPVCYVESTVGTDLGLPSSSVSPKVRSEVTRSLPTIKLDQYDGSTPLETHLAKFNNCSSYYGWTVKDR